MRLKRTWCVLLAAVVWITGMTTVSATINSIQSQKAQNERELQNIQSRISSLESQKSALSNELSGLNDELVDTLLNIEILESDLADKEVEIQEAQAAYEEAKATEERQYESMKLRIQYLYESGNVGYMELLLTSESVADLVNKVDYAEELQEYDRRLLDEYKAVKQAVIELQKRLEEEKEELLILQEQMEQEKANLQSMIARKQNEISDFNNQLNAAKSKAGEYQRKIKEQNAQIKKLQEEAARVKAAKEAAAKKAKSASGGKSSDTSSAGTSSTASTPEGNGAMGVGGSEGGSSSSGGGSGSSSGSGGGSGSSIASYGLNFVGCPYVLGGNSLTGGTDCSGFVSLVHAHFGISTPRSSGGLAGGGRAVSDSEKQPGDVVCYPGHVGIYIGNNQIVHASTPSTGIKVSNMYYRSVLCIRRYW